MNRAELLAMARAASEGVYYTHDLVRALRAALPGAIERMEVSINKYRIYLQVDTATHTVLWGGPTAKGKRGDFVLDARGKPSMWCTELAGVTYATDPCVNPGYSEAILAAVVAVNQLGIEGAYAHLGKAYGRCAVCGAFLVDELSIARGIGPECLRKIGVRQALRAGEALRP